METFFPLKLTGKFDKYVTKVELTITNMLYLPVSYIYSGGYTEMVFGDGKSIHKEQIALLSLICSLGIGVLL